VRDILVTIIVFGGLPYVLMRPHVGVYLWSWIGYMNPHRLGWGFAAGFPFAAIIGLVTLVALTFSKEPKRVPMMPVTVVLILFIAWVSFTTLFATNPEEATDQLSKVLKIQLMTFVTMMMFADRQRLHQLVWVIVVSLGFYGVKGGLYTILTGGQSMVLGPAGTFIAGNTEIALALNMVIPLMRYLQLQSSQRWLRWALGAAMALSAVAVVGSYSRGAFLAGAAIGLFLLWKSKRRVLLGGIMVLLIPLIIAFMPDKYTKRMETIETYEQDTSAMGRVNAWKFAFQLATKRFLGGGFEAFTPENYARYAPRVMEQLMATRQLAQDAHSIYFEVLGEHGFVGLALFMLLGVLMWRTGSWVIRHGKKSEEHRWAVDLASMVQVTLAGYAVGGAFLGLAYFDLYYHLIAILVVMKVLLLKEQAAHSAERKGPSAARPMTVQRGRGGY
jgi:probable O-glycosylation ligase (exosortase A-associated)